MTYAARMFVVVVSLIAALGFAHAVYAQEDITPPALLDMEFSPSEIDTSSGPVTITVSVHVTDDLSGVGWMHFAFHKKDTTQKISVDLAPGKNWTNLAEGDNLNGTYQNSFVLPQYAAFGEWELYYFGLIDNVGNRVDLWKPEDDGSEGLKRGNDEWPSLFNGFVFSVGIEQQLPEQLFMPLALH